MNRAENRTANRTAIAVNRLRAAASQVRVDEASEVLAHEFALDLGAIADGEFSHEALEDAVITLARVRGWRRAWG